MFFLTYCLKHLKYIYAPKLYSFQILLHSAVSSCSHCKTNEQNKPQIAMQQTEHRVIFKCSLSNIQSVAFGFSLVQIFRTQ